MELQDRLLLTLLTAAILQNQGW